MLYGKAVVAIQENAKEICVSNGVTPIGMRLAEWKSDVIIRVQTPDSGSKMTAPYFYVDSRYGLVPWVPTMIEQFKDTWELVACSD